MTARVLIVDDDTETLAELDRLLGEEFFDTLTADSGEDAVRLARREAPDLILVDTSMPGIDGFETCRRLKADPETAHVPVVMMTSVDQPAARLRGLSVGADDFLVRPVQPVELFARVRSLVRLKTLFDEIRAREATGGALGLNTVLDVSTAEDRATIIVVDDGNERIPEFLTMLRSFGTVATVPADRAIDRLRKTPCDIIVVGLAGSRVDGLRLVSRLRSHSETRRVPILAFVDAADSSPLVKGFELGVSDCVKLPVDMLEVVARVRTLLRRKRLTERMRQNVMLSMRLATTDAVTGLYNRHYMMHHLTTTIARARANARPMALMMIDIDHFKAINDTYGHAAGDKALRVVADRLASNVRGVDLTARYGGEEFAVVMPETDMAAAAAVAERLRATVAAEPVATEGERLPVTISIGVAVLADTDEDGITLLSRADQALYAAKRGGRNRVVQASTQDAAA